jgi:hypothetical protein
VPPFGLSDEHRTWIANRIHGYRDDIAQHPEWEGRLRIAIDNLLWSYSVDSLVGGKVVQDGWIAAGTRLREHHFRNAPSTESARKAFRTGDHKAVRREHIVPRAVLYRLVLRTGTPGDTKRILDAYALVALVTTNEAGRLQQRTMPKGWDHEVEWGALPERLPDAWARYRKCRPEPVLPLTPNGAAAYS